ncbi:porin [Paraburkholderia silvatlantica]|uniref:Porin n=1 Tax=Paraburkholderia silvatlantica TaxID=321895 RepID=A0A2U1A635_9BURK|nr:porin [Paraburkholderia silvatlantica]MBB2929201.1 putative porin [Paraburkholderia silvatlantica]PVY27232.1 putative porin [Paraburkholderia silvatlantica]PXW34261.1 putative porin [Paraburkholderia silvatlantica]PYE22254.1 putative porin [Paraburkholderia silvatlantica]TDQ85156.1 putative porin [Paraburkholderia silvatlantica]
MKNTLIIAGVLGAFAASAHAQSSVTLYGALDAGIVYANNAGGHAAWNQGSGAVGDTYFGLKGSEDLGGGLHAIFTLENGFNLNNGKDTESGTMFNRQAFVGLQSDRFGTLTLGRQYDSMVDYLGPLSEAGSGYGNNLAAHPFDNDNLDHSFSIKNAVKYQSVNYQGFKFGGLYGFSNDAGQFANNRAWSAGASYGNGPLNFAAAYLQMNNSPTNTNANGANSASNGNNFNLSAQTQRTFGAGVNYNYGPATVGFVWTHTQYENLIAGGQGGNTFSIPSGTNLHMDNFELNGAYALTPALALNASYTYTDGKVTGSNGSGDPKWHTVSLTADYSLSKRTDVYAGAVYQHASGELGDAGANVAMINTLSPSTSQNQVAATVGLRHRF